MTCTRCGNRMNPFTARCQNKNCERARSDWAEREARRRRENADSPDFVEQTPPLFDFEGATQ